MNKKLVKILIINLSIVAILLVITEFIMYKNAVVEYNNFYKVISKLIPPPTFTESYKARFQPQTIQYLETTKDLEIRPFEENANHIKKPILLFGCSFTHGGVFLNDNQTVSHKLSELTQRNVYNFAMCGCGLQHMLYIIQNRLKQYLSPNIEPEYAIYFYIPNHIQRLRATIFPSVFYNGTVLHYNMKNSKLEQEKRLNSFIYKTFMVKAFYYNLDRKREQNQQQDMYDNFINANEILKATREELEKRYPNIKFIIVRYQIENDDTYREAPYMWEELEKQGFIIINSEDLIGRKFKYHSEDTNVDEYHPSEKAWDTLLPPLIEKLEL